MRHGETTWNAARRFQGFADSPLNDTGREQARHAAKHLTQAGIEGIVASDLMRARDTAKIVGDTLGLQIRTDRRLREIDVGEWQGKPYDEVKQGPQIAHWQTPSFYYEFRFPGGDSRAELGHRAVAALKQIAQEQADEHTLVVAHGGTIRMILFVLFDVHDIKHIPNTSLTRLSVTEEKWTLIDIAEDAAALQW
jgi:broad specificity phosphatase PhoE